MNETNWITGQNSCFWQWRELNDLTKSCSFFQMIFHVWKWDLVLYEISFSMRSCFHNFSHFGHYAINNIWAGIHSHSLHSCSVSSCPLTWAAEEIDHLKNAQNTCFAGYKNCFYQSQLFLPILNKYHIGLPFNQEIHVCVHHDMFGIKQLNSLRLSLLISQTCLCFSDCEATLKWADWLVT